MELPSRLIKQRRTDLAPILRQQQQQLENSDFSYAATRAQRSHHLLHSSSPFGGPSQHQHRSSSSSSSSLLLPAGVRGMCAELQEVFGMSINAAPLPFPLKDGAVASPQPAVVLGSANASASASIKALGGRNPDESIELTRAPRDSEVCIASRLLDFDAFLTYDFYFLTQLSVAGRTSLLHGYDGPLSASKSANASYMDGAGTEGGYTYNNNEDFGDSAYYGGPGDDVFFNPSQQDHQQQQLMDFGEEGADEEKAGDARVSSSAHSSRQKQKQHQQQLARNAVSDLVSNTFSKSAAELDSHRHSRSSSGNSSGNSSSRHTRTEQFMDILDDEFRANKVRTNPYLVS